jgi:hypothetical protein
MASESESASVEATVVIDTRTLTELPLRTW